MSKDPNIEETLEKLTELTQGYQRVLESSNRIISMKSRYIELCEQETELHRKENVRLQKTVFWLSVLLTISSVIHFINIFI